MAANTPENELTGTMGKENVVINLYYSLDVKGGDEPAKPDGIPDKYQVKVTFKVKNGAWNDETTTDVVKYLTKYKDVDGEQVMAADGEAVLGDIIPAAGEKPDSGFIVGDWGNNEPDETTAITGDTTYTYTYKPAPGRVTITVNFVDEDGNVVGTETVVVDEGDDYDVSEEVEKIPEGYEPNGDPAGDPVTGIADTDKTVIVPVRQYIRYIVTYTDGVDGEEVFADQVTSNLVSGAATPAFVGTCPRGLYFRRLDTDSNGYSNGQCDLYRTVDTGRADTDTDTRRTGANTDTGRTGADTGRTGTNAGRFDIDA